ncbi:MAG TPA: hypothetical protein VLW48_03530 [Candidatus Bathyarchaeia archaeon]|nr:hypothetical protein [Candidatus Bathyarchaeia archaeon]
MSPRQKDPSITAAERLQYETLVPLLDAMHEDIRQLALKSQTSALSKSRIAMLNRLLADAQKLLKHEPAAAYLQVLDEATVPQNADALLVLGQFKAALEQFRDRYMYYDEDEGETVWRVR